MCRFNQQTSGSRNDYDTGIRPQDVSMNAISQKISMNAIRTQKNKQHKM